MGSLRNVKEVQVGKQDLEDVLWSRSKTSSITDDIITLTRRIITLLHKHFMLTQHTPAVNGFADNSE